MPLSTASRVFIDSSGFFALLVRDDDRHAEADRTLQEAARRGRLFVTSDYVLDETATLLKARGRGHLVKPLLDRVFQGEACQVEWMDPARFAGTQSFFLKHSDHAWSFTDCFSFVLMRELRLREALTKDAHFREAGFRPLLV